MMFRITDEQHTNAMVAAVNRGVPVRLITDETEYRNAARLWDAYNVDQHVLRRRAGALRRPPGHQPRQAGAAARHGHVDLRIVELDLAVERLAA